MLYEGSLSNQVTLDRVVADELIGHMGSKDRGTLDSKTYR